MISNVSGAVNSASFGTTSADNMFREAGNELGKEAFLKILITQLANQDPMDPLKDKDFIAQMAQFSTLEQMTNMNKSIEQMNALTKGAAVSYIGRVIEYVDEDGISQVGEVAFVRFDKSGVILTTTDKVEIPLERVVAVG
jgi:flagellar basal-body rod modification protein FlgD